MNNQNYGSGPARAYPGQQAYAGAQPQPPQPKVDENYIVNLVDRNPYDGKYARCIKARLTDWNVTTHDGRVITLYGLKMTCVDKEGKPLVTKDGRELNPSWTTNASGRNIPKYTELGIFFRILAENFGFPMENIDVRSLENREFYFSRGLWKGGKTARRMFWTPFAMTDDNGKFMEVQNSELLTYEEDEPGDSGNDEPKFASHEALIHDWFSVAENRSKVQTLNDFITVIKGDPNMRHIVNFLSDDKVIEALGHYVMVA